LEARELCEKQENLEKVQIKKQEIEHKVSKKDNIVLSVSDLSNKKIVQTKNSEIKKLIKSVKASEINCKDKAKDKTKEKSVEDTKDTSPSVTPPIPNIIKVNTCEIINARRPRSVTASFFSSQTAPQSTAATTSTLTKSSIKPTLLQRAKIVANQQANPNHPKPHNVTSKLFAPFTRDMSKGFFMFSEDESGLTSK
jgi:hypothetical protein